MTCEVQLGHEHRKGRSRAVRHRACPSTSVLDEGDNDSRGKEDQQRAHAEEIPGKAGGCDDGENSSLDGVPCQSHDGVRDDRDDYWLDAEQHTGACVSRSVADIGPGEDEHEQHRRQDETGASDDEPRPAFATTGQHESDLGRRRPGEQARPADEVEQFLLAHPASARDELRAHHREMRRRTAESRGAETEIRPRHLAERRPHLRCRFAGVRVARRHAHYSWPRKTRTPVRQRPTATT